MSWGLWFFLYNSLEKGFLSINKFSLHSINKTQTNIYLIISWYRTFCKFKHWIWKCCWYEANFQITCP
jgi:hypothetical protein